MVVARATQITATSNSSLEDAVARGFASAHDLFNNLRGAWIENSRMAMGGDGAPCWEVVLKCTYSLDD